MTLIGADKARETMIQALVRAGVTEEGAWIQSEVLLEAELRGLASHGLMRLPRLIERIANGVADPKVTGSHKWLRSAFLEVDGQAGLGPVVAMAALSQVRKRAAECGSAIAAIRNSNHLGMLGYYAENVAEQGQTLIGLSTSEALVHPWGGRTAMLGTNPIAIGLPTESGTFVVDTATSIVSMGKIHDYAQRGEPIPGHWALDEDGNPTTDPVRAKNGSIAPFGEAKGYALGLAIELLVGNLAQAALGRDVRGTLDSTETCNKGDVFIVIDGPAGQLAPYLEQIRQSPPADGFDSVRIPGDRSTSLRSKRMNDGLPVEDRVWAQIRQLAEVGHDQPSPRRPV